MLLASIDPATGEVVGTVACTPVDAVPAVVARSRAAQPAWEAIALDDRLARLVAAGPALRDAADRIGALASREMGKPLRQARGEAGWVARSHDAELAQIADALRPVVQEDARTRSRILRDPFGVAACITPWNFPVSMPAQQLLPALLAGNTVVFKPSEQTPLTGEAYARILADVLPDDVLQIVHGDEAQGRALVAGDVDLVVFTGSRAAGKHILAEASKRLKRVILELGGKDPLIVLEGADLDAAARFAARNSFRNSGQVCVSTERIYVEDGVHDAFVAGLVDAAAALRVGDPAAPDTDLGPMVHGVQKAHVVQQVDAAVAAGATVAWRGPDGPGNFLHPVVLTGVDHGMAVATEETFGPVASVIRVTDADDAVRLANDSPYGLGAVVFGPPATARAAARRLKAGMIGVNRGIGGAGPTPWVGARESGYGFHSGPEGHRQFAQVRTLSEPL